MAKKIYILKPYKGRDNTPEKKPRITAQDLIRMKQKFEQEGKEENEFPKLF